MLDTVLPQYVHFQVYQMILNARASEHSARMVAMKNATDNAKQIIKDLTLEYNKVRQAAITTELLEIIYKISETTPKWRSARSAPFASFLLSLTWIPQPHLSPVASFRSSAPSLTWTSPPRATCRKSTTRWNSNTMSPACPRS